MLCLLSDEKNGTVYIINTATKIIEQIIEVTIMLKSSHKQTVSVSRIGV